MLAWPVVTHSTLPACPAADLTQSTACCAGRKHVATRTRTRPHVRRRSARLLQETTQVETQNPRVEGGVAPSDPGWRTATEHWTTDATSMLAEPCGTAPCLAAMPARALCLGASGHAGGLVEACPLDSFLSTEGFSSALDLGFSASSQDRLSRSGVLLPRSRSESPTLAAG